MTKQVQDVFATLKTWREGFPPQAGTTHWFAVVVRFTDGTQSQEIECRSLRDCLLVGNGILAGLAAVGAGGDRYAVNVVFDPRFEQ